MYSLKIREEYIPILYRISKERGRPMTFVVNEIIAAALKEADAEKANNSDPSERYQKRKDA